MHSARIWMSCEEQGDAGKGGDGYVVPRSPI
jgi:hypothetical protein